MSHDLEIVALGPPGLETELAAEVSELGFTDVTVEPAGVAFKGSWEDVWRANLWLRGASRVLVRVASFPALHLAQLDKRARKIDWRQWLPRRASAVIEATCRKSKIFHSGAAAERVDGAIRAATGAIDESDGDHLVIVRIHKNICTISLDTSGDLLHRRGFKEAVAKAPLRETLAALFLRRCGYSGDEPLIDPMCGSGTIPIEAAEMARGLPPGRGRAFRFEQLTSYDPSAFAAIKSTEANRLPMPFVLGTDKNEDAVRAAVENAGRAGLADAVRFAAQPISTLERPEGPAGLILVNPPYGTRLGDKSSLTSLYRSLGKVAKERFAGWRVGLITTDHDLANATGLKWTDVSPPVPHGGLKIKLYRTSPL